MANFNKEIKKAIVFGQKKAAKVERRVFTLVCRPVLGLISYESKKLERITIKLTFFS